MVCTRSINCKVLTISLQIDDLWRVLFTKSAKAPMHFSGVVRDRDIDQLRMVMQEKSERFSARHTASA